MSEVRNPSPGEPQEATPRRAMSIKRRVVLWKRQAGLCADCGMVILPNGEMHVDHVLPLELGGSNFNTNLQCLCHECHAAKTREDMRRILKARRIRRKADPEQRKKPTMRGRGFARDPLSWRNT